MTTTTTSTTASTAAGHALFDTAVGRCAVAWSERGITALWLPEADEAALRRRIAQRTSGSRESEPPPPVQAAVAKVVALLAGEPTDLADIELDWRGVPPFHRKVFELARGIAPGRTRTYGEIAAALGDVQAARAVGQALGRNPYTLIVPCHRVLGAQGASGGFSAPGGVATKLKLLEIEGAQARGTSSLPF